MRCPDCHGRAWAGHPRLLADADEEDVDGWATPGHDSGIDESLSTSVGRSPQCLLERRQGAANGSFLQEVNPVFADVHLRVLSVLRFHFLCLLPALEPGELDWGRVCPGFAQSGLSDRKENGTANHAEHAKGGGAFQGHDDAFDLKARLAEVE